MSFEITRVFICFNDAVNILPGTSGGIAGFSIQLPNYLENVVFLELLNAPVSLSGVFIQLNGWGESSLSSGKVYWRFVETTNGFSNNRLVDLKNSITRRPERLRTLDFLLYNGDGSLFNLNNTDNPALFMKSGFELEIYSLKKD
jgi:hypothetical protein